MGDHGIPDSFVNMSGQRSPYTKAGEGIGGGGKGVPDEGVKGNRTGVEKEYNGPHFAPQTTLYAPNAAEASDQPRNVRLVRSAVGNRDFWESRQANAGGE
jgi:hypothetical protein